MQRACGLHTFMSPSCHTHDHLWMPTAIHWNWKWHHFDKIFITACTVSCQNDNFLCSHWWKVHQNNTSISVLYQLMSPSKLPGINGTWCRQCVRYRKQALRKLQKFSKQIEAKTKWPIFCRYHLQMYFLDKKLCFDSNFVELCSIHR